MYLPRLKPVVEADNVGVVQFAEDSHLGMDHVKPSLEIALENDLDSDFFAVRYPRCFLYYSKRACT